MIDYALPLVDLHRHLDGNIQPHTIWELAQKHHIQLPANTLQEVEQLTQINDKTSDLLAFLAKLDVGVSVLADYDACYKVAYENMRDAKNSRLDYVELRFSPYYMAKSHDLNMVDLIAAVIDGVRAGEKDFAVKANLIGILSRTFGAQTCMQELDALLAYQDDLVALDLAGDELGYPAELFMDHFVKARDADWHITVHAGEADGPQSIWNAIYKLGASRIGHGVTAVQDEKLLAYMADNKIAIESCPTSNYQTATVKNLKKHPMATFLKHNVLVTLNTDDPAVSNIDIAHEYQIAHEVLGISEQQLKTIQLNGVKAAFLSDDEKKALLNKGV
ncbi:adenosine deaminase [Aliiglaciecola sp. 2_MG-2023]|uniref:adenosine deaminase n=1 Tax=unclassified Aliiglaciecola TaxID=2593648 RepID=UPI0026E24049|nr:MULTISPECIES: adenosine deaminase [unclassified Aliiglaciecola]MDO6712088.1 adenosine deaminase [Aliiglaciecola sp. 2_MG-2023]MDO6753168.1 adenosine deaminase [Aliiglaciecola sp. 1_MG-2023]